MTHTHKRPTVNNTKKSPKKNVPVHVKTSPSVASSKPSTAIPKLDRSNAIKKAPENKFEKLIGLK